MKTGILHFIPLLVTHFNDIPGEAYGFSSFFVESSNLMLIALGVACIIVELFIPGGIVGGIGIAIILGTIYFGTAGVGQFVLVLLAVAIMVVLILFIIIKILGKERLKNKFFLNIGLTKETGFSTGRDLSIYMDRLAKTKSVLRPTGKIEIDGEILDASSETVMIEAGVEVKIISVEGNRIVVRKQTKEEL